MNQSQASQKSSSRILYSCWGIITVVCAAFVGLLIHSLNATPVNSETIGGVVFLLMTIIFWVLLSFILFLVFKQKVAAWIFGLLILVIIGYVLIKMLI